MQKRTTSIFTALILALFLATAAGAASVTCTVENVTDGKVLLDCGQTADKISVGDKVKVRTKPERRAVEGC